MGLVGIIILLAFISHPISSASTALNGYMFFQLRSGSIRGLHYIKKPNFSTNIHFFALIYVK